MCGCRYSFLLKNCQTFPKWLHHFIFLPAVCEGSILPTSSVTPAFVCLFDYSFHRLTCRPRCSGDVCKHSAWCFPWCFFATLTLGWEAYVSWETGGFTDGVVSLVKVNVYVKATSKKFLEILTCNLCQ